MGQVLHARANESGKVHLFGETGIRKRVSPGLDPRAFSVYRSESISVAVGDKVCALEPINGMERGDRATIQSIDHWARMIKLDDGREVSMDSKHLGYGYVTTVPGAQGLSVDSAIVVVTTSSLPALSQEGLYVAASRGRHHLCIITDDLEAVREAVARARGVNHGIDVAEEARLRERLERGEPAELDDLMQDILEASAPAIDPSMNAPRESGPACDVADDDGPRREPALVGAVGPSNRNPDSNLEHPPAEAVVPRSSQFAGVWPVPADMLDPQPDVAARTPAGELGNFTLDDGQLDIELDLERLNGDRTEPVVPTQGFENLDVPPGDSVMPTQRFEQPDIGANNSVEIPGPHAVTDRREHAVPTEVVVPRRVEPDLKDSEFVAALPVVEDFRVGVDVTEPSFRTWRDIETTTTAEAASGDVEPTEIDPSLIVAASDPAQRVGDEAPSLPIEDRPRSTPGADVSHPDEIEPRAATEPELQTHVDVAEEIEKPQLSEPEFDLEL